MREKKLYFNVKYNFLYVLSVVSFLIDLDIGLLLSQILFPTKPITSLNTYDFTLILSSIKTRIV
jgi:hypothetical protein